MVTFVLSGLIFVLPQYLQAVLGYDAFGTGLRLMPLMAGMLVAARAAAPLVRLFGARLVVSAGLTVFAFAALLASRTSVDDGYGFTALWLTVIGFGFGFAMVPVMDTALGALPRDRAGTGTGLLQTLRQVGAAIGVALLGSLLNSVYTDDLDTGRLPAAAADAAKDSVMAAHAIADRLDLGALAASADAAYISGMNLIMLVCAVTALLTAALTAVFLPNARPDDEETEKTRPADARQ
jgi:Na+/melibiose symporter-like transporter